MTFVILLNKTALQSLGRSFSEEDDDYDVSLRGKSQIFSTFSTCKLFSSVEAIQGPKWEASQGEALILLSKKNPNVSLLKKAIKCIPGT